MDLSFENVGILMECGDPFYEANLEGCGVLLLQEVCFEEVELERWLLVVSILT